MTPKKSGTNTDLTNYQALANFRHALRVFERFSEQAARAEGLTPAQHQLLLAVKGYSQGGKPPVTHLAEMLQLKVHSVGELIDRAQANGLVTTANDPADLRRTLVSLTRKGESHLARLTSLHRTEVLRFKNEMGAILANLSD